MNAQSHAAHSISAHEPKTEAGVGHEMTAHDLGLFEATRSGLMAIACRLLRSHEDAEDAVQDCFLKWAAAQRVAIASPVGWLATVCQHRCLDLLRAARYSRVDYLGASIPEAIEPFDPHDTDSNFSASLTTACSLMLQRLTPRERAAYVLHEIFERSVSSVAATLQTNAGACQKLIERARVHISRDKVRCVTPASTKTRLLRAFQGAIATGDPAQLVALLARDAHTNGGRTRATLRVLGGRTRPAHDHVHDLQGNRSDEISISPCIDHRRKRQDRRSSQRAA